MTKYMKHDMNLKMLLLVVFSALSVVGSTLLYVSQLEGINGSYNKQLAELQSTAIPLPEDGNYESALLMMADREEQLMKIIASERTATDGLADENESLKQELKNLQTQIKVVQKVSEKANFVPLMGTRAAYRVNRY